MDGFDNQSTHDHTQAGGAIADPRNTSATSRTNQSTGISSQNEDFTAALDSSVEASSGDHNHAPPPNVSFELHTSLDKVASPRGLDVKKLQRQGAFDLGSRGDFLNPKGGVNTVIGSVDNDVIKGAGGGLNTITTGSGRDAIILGKETTNRIFDFDPANDRFVLQGIKPKDIIIAQGKNPGRGGLAQPLDSANNALVIDKGTGHILAALPFVKASDLSERNFARMSGEARKSLTDLKDKGFKTQRGNGKLTGTKGHDRLVGGDGNDFLYVGDDGFKLNTAKGTGGTEFPFATDSKGTSELNAELKNGTLKVKGSYKDFQGMPLFSQGETTIDPKAKILNGSDPVSLVNGFLRVPKDVEGNPLSGTHLHFSPANDARGNFADATVIRFFKNTPTDRTSGKVSGQFNLTPEEQAALLAGTMYVNIHTNIGADPNSDKAGFPTGENRLNFNRDVVKFV